MNSLLRKQGYVVFNEIDLCTYSYQTKYSRKQITDLDVLGMKCDPDLNFNSVVTECKSREEKAMEYLLKLKGTMDFFHASKAYFVQKRIDINAREVGRDLNIFCLDENNLGSILASMGVRDPEFKLFEQNLYAEKVNALKTVKKDFQKAVDYLKYDFWTLPDNRNVINILKIIETNAKKLDPSVREHKILIYELCLLLTLALLRLAGEIIKLNSDNVPDGVKTLIMGGTRERRDREALFDEIRKVIKDDRLNPYPIYLQDLTELINRLILSLDNSHSCLKCMEYFVIQNCLDGAVGPWEKEKSALSEITIKLTRDILRFVMTRGGVPGELFAKQLVD